MSLPNRITAWVDKEAGMDPVTRTRVRVQHLVGLLLVLIGGTYVALFVWLGLIFASWFLAIVIVIAQVGLFGFTRQGRPDIGGRIVSVSVFATITNALIARGGMDSNSAAWLLLVPVLAFLMVGSRHGVLTSVAAAVAFVAIWAAEHFNVAMPPGLPEEVCHWLIILDYPTIALTIAGMLWVQAGVWDRVISQLDQTNHQLIDEVVVRKRAEEAAYESARARSAFLAIMSHEIRTPLNGVLGLTDILMGTTLTNEQRQLTATVRDSGEQLRSLLNDVLDFSKIDSGHLDLEMMPVDLRSLCQAVVALWHGPAREQGLSLTVRFDESIPKWIRSDPTRLRQILGNLVSNAIKFTPSGHVLIHVRGGERLTIDVEDSGIGLEDGAEARIFEPFRQADNTTTRNHGGTGLGLAICRRLTEAMEGTLSVSSVLGQGTTFTLDLPLVILEPVAAPSNTDEALPLEGCVLVAEDNPVNQMVIRHKLERHGLRVLIAENGDHCVRMWGDRRPDLILMDCQMPVMDGYTATRRIRAIDPLTPIIAVTANTMPGDRKLSLEAGMNGHLGKPIEREELTAVLQQWLPKSLPKSLSA